MPRIKKVIVEEESTGDPFHEMLLRLPEEQHEPMIMELRQAEWAARREHSLQLSRTMEAQRLLFESETFLADCTRKRELAENLALEVVTRA